MPWVNSATYSRSHTGAEREVQQSSVTGLPWGMDVSLLRMPLMCRFPVCRPSNDFSVEHTKVEELEYLLREFRAYNVGERDKVGGNRSRIWVWTTGAGE